MRVLGFVFIAVAAVVPLHSAIGQGAHTTRIETRPYYGAVVTVEEGVRVFRPVPPTQHMIINPGGLTPLMLGIDNRPLINQNAQATSVTVSPGR